MNFAVPFSLNFQYFDDNVQLNIIYKPKIEKLQTFIETYGTNHRINIQITDLQNINRDLDLIQVLKEKNPEAQIVINIPLSTPLSIINIIQEKSLPFFISDMIIDINNFNYLLSLQVTDIRIGGWLGFFVTYLSEKAKEKQIALRAYPDICQSYTGDLTSFFIRPEDINFYSKYIDTFDFAHDIKSINTIYQIYVKDKQWYGPLQEIILNYKGDIDSRYILPVFAQLRSSCKQRCLYDNTNRCHHCTNLYTVANHLKDKNIIIEKGEQNEKLK